MVNALSAEQRRMSTRVKVFTLDQLCLAIVNEKTSTYESLVLDNVIFEPVSMIAEFLGLPYVEFSHQLTGPHPPLHVNIMLITHKVHSVFLATCGAMDSALIAPLRPDVVLRATYLWAFQRIPQALQRIPQISATYQNLSDQCMGGLTDVDLFNQWLPASSDTSFV